MSHDGYGPIRAVQDVGYFCPACQSVEIEVSNHGRLLLNPDGVGRTKARCLLCGWHGFQEDVIGALAPSNESFWTPERVAQALLVGASKHAAGPMVQLLELIGLVPKIEGSIEEQASARTIREAVVKAVLEGVVTAAFETAGELAPAHFKHFHPELVRAAETALREDDVQAR